MRQVLDFLQRCVRRVSRKRVYGLLSYSTQNIGDEIQSLAAKAFLPQVDLHIDRERIHEASVFKGSVKLIMNGWFCHRPDLWPPTTVIEPLLISMHFTNNPEPGSGMRAQQQLSSMPPALEYLRRNGPVGARDYFTLEWLRNNDVPCYYSGCLTLALDRPDVPREPFIVLNDVPQTVAAAIERTTDRQIRRTTHFHSSSDNPTRMERARKLIEVYASAHAVVTTRLHAALPCLAMGTPVLLIDESWDQSRFTGLNELVFRCGVDEFVSGGYAYNLDDPPSNPERHLELRENLKSRVSTFIRHT